jgi:hypothetical protein
MKRLTIIIGMTLTLAAAGTAAELKGFVEDQACAGKPGMKDDAACAEKCIKGGSPAVLVTDDGKIYKVANQDKITPFAGKNVTVTGDVKGDTVTVSDVK